MTNSSSQSNYEKLAVSPLEVVELLDKSKLTQSVSTSHWTSAVLKALQYLKVSPEVEFSDGPDFKSVMVKNGIRFRLIEPEEIESEVDFGILVASSKDGNTSYTIRYSGKKIEVHAFDEGSDSSYRTIQRIDLLFDEVSAIYEVYPPLPYSLNSLFDFLGFVFSQFKLELFYVALFTSISMGLQLLFPQLTVYVASTVISIGSLGFAFQIGLVAVLLAGLSTAALYLQSLFILRLETVTDKRAQVAVWDRLLKADLSMIDGFSSADLMLRASTIGEIKKLLSSGNITSLIGILFSFFDLGLMYNYFPNALLGILPLVILFVYFVISRAKTGGTLLTASLDARANLTSKSNSLIALQSELRTRNCNESFVANWLNTSENYGKLTRSYRSRDISIEIMSNSFQPLCFLVSFVVIEATTDPGAWGDPAILMPMLGYTSALTLFTSNLSKGANVVADSFVRVMAYWKRAEPIVFTPIERGYAPGSQAVELDGSIVLEKISVKDSYSGSELFKNLSCFFPPKTISYVQSSSEIKPQYLFDLILGIVNIDSGSIMLTGIPIEKHSISALRSQIAVCSKDPYLPMGALGDLLDGPLTSNEDDFIELLDVVGLMPLIESLRMGLDTPVPENGICFSTVQKQRISLAMALVRNPTVLLLNDCMDSFEIEDVLRILSFALLNSITTLIYDPRLRDLDNISGYIDSIIDID